MDLTKLRGNPLNSEGVPISDSGSWKQVAVDLQAAVARLKRNPEAVGTLVKDELRKAFPDAAVVFPGK
jgi:hypothetical protein